MGCDLSKILLLPGSKQGFSPWAGGAVLVAPGLYVPFLGSLATCQDLCYQWGFSGKN